MTRAAQSACWAALLLALSGCGGQQVQQTMLRPAGPMAARIENLWWFIFVIALAVFVIVFALFSGAIATRRVRGQAQPEIEADPVLEQRQVRIVIGATVLSVLILFSILGY